MYMAMILHALAGRAFALVLPDSRARALASGDEPDRTESDHHQWREIENYGHLFRKG
jgi:hypothetical protein